MKQILSENINKSESNGNTMLDLINAIESIEKQNNETYLPPLLFYQSETHIKHGSNDYFTIYDTNLILETDIESFFVLSSTCDFLKIKILNQS